MGIDQEKKIAQRELEAAKPTTAELTLVGYIAGFQYGPSNNFKTKLTEALIEFRIQLTASILAGEGYDTTQDIEKRQVLSVKLANSERNNNLLRESNERLTKANGLLATELAFIKEELNGFSNSLEPTVSLLYHPSTDEKL